MSTMANDIPPAAAFSTSQRFGLADLQVHTDHGDGMAGPEEIFGRVERSTHLDVMAVTDHDDITGALRAREVHARGDYHFEFITGIEVTTRSGHLLALFVEEPIPSFRSLEATVAAIHRQGGLAVIPHPLSPLTRSIGQRGLDRVLKIEDPTTHPDGIEVVNLTLAGRATGKKALRLNRERWQLAETGGSDAHFPEEVGSAATLFPGSTAADVRAAILSKRSRGIAVAPVGLGEIGVRRLAVQQVRGLAVTPRKVLGPQVRRAQGGVRRSLDRALGRPSNGAGR